MNYGTADFTELFCDLVGYGVVQGIRGDAFKSGKFTQDYIPFVVVVGAYNLGLRKAIVANIPPTIGETKTIGPFSGTLGEVLTLGTSLWMVDNYVIAGKSRQGWMEHALDVLAMRGVSNELLKIKGSFGIPVPQ